MSSQNELRFFLFIFIFIENFQYIITEAELDAIDLLKIDVGSILQIIYLKEFMVNINNNLRKLEVDLAESNN